MNIKNNLIKSKSLLITIICSLICIILIRQFVVLDITPYDNSQNLNSQTIMPEHTYATSPSNSRTLEVDDEQVPTLSRGYVGDFNSELTNKVESDNDNYEDDLYTLNKTALIDNNYIKQTSVRSNSNIPKESQMPNKHLTSYLMYKNVHVTNLKAFLKSRNSLLAEEPYLSTILSVSKDFNLNPLVMFAITGQEQSFVPKSNKNANKIANNPFNVFNSWKKYNTNIEDATKIAARTIVNLSKNKPDNIDAFTWINRKYCEDQNWSKAVRSIFKQLEGNVSYWK